MYGTRVNLKQQVHLAPKGNAIDHYGQLDSPQILKFIQLHEPIVYRTHPKIRKSTYRRTSIDVLPSKIQALSEYCIHILWRNESDFKKPGMCKKSATDITIGFINYEASNYFNMKFHSENYSQNTDQHLVRQNKYNLLNNYTEFLHHMQ